MQLSTGAAEFVPRAAAPAQLSTSAAEFVPRAASPAPSQHLKASAATFVLLQYATLCLPSAKVMAYTYLTPSWVILWEIALGHGAPRPLILIGIAMTVVALVLLLRNEET